MYRAYAAVMDPVLRSGAVRATLVVVTVALFGVAGWLGLARQVPLKMLPFDDKNELQVVVDLPEGSTLQRTDGVLAAMAAVLRGVPEVTEVLSSAGAPSPIDFNGMVRGYARRVAPHLGDLRVNLVPKDQRDAGSHALAIRIRRWLAPLAAEAGATLQVVEMPPGPPVIATVVVEVRGAPSTPLAELEAAARAVAARLAAEPGVTDVDVSAEQPSPRLRYRLDREQAALVGVDEASAARILATAVAGAPAAVFHAPRERNPLVAEVRLPEPRRAVAEELERLPVPSAGGGTVPLGEIGRFEPESADRSLRRKNVERVVYVFAEVEGRAPADVILDVQADQVAPAALATAIAAPRPVAGRTFLAPGGGIPWAVPADIALDWTGEGEWKITLDAFRDLGLAFLAACVGIYVLLVHETRSYGVPLVLMLSIPFTIIGILPGFWLLNALTAGEVAGVAEPVFFTATAMIGMIALAGIAVRNAILLIEFVRNELDAGTAMRDAVVRAGANRIRPIFLTAGTALLAAIPITLDPIFSGLAWALIFGLLVSSVFTLVLVPMVYARVVREPDHR